VGSRGPLKAGLMRFERLLDDEPVEGAREMLGAGEEDSLETEADEAADESDMSIRQQQIRRSSDLYLSG